MNVFEGLVKERLEDGLVLSSPGLMHPLKVDPDASVVDNVPVWVALRTILSASSLAPASFSSYACFMLSASVRLLSAASYISVT